jgi:uncharacterized protein YggE
MNEIAEITVTATSSVKEMPDGIRLDMTVNAQSVNYALASEQLNQKVFAVNAALAQVCARTEATTKSYSIDEVWTDPYDEDKRKLIGYRGTQKLSITIDLNNDLLGRALAVLSTCDGNPNIGVTFVVRNTEPMERTARITAVKKAHEAANDLASASGLKLIAVKSISYSSPKKLGGSSLHLPELDQFDAPSMPTIRPDSVSHEEGVRMVWLSEPAAAGM